ncbi:acyl-coenzyme A diphosphatase NUDT19-like [Liolophura sinensis]|uniref:acyl-coenzyme A diphosphatase NUDT19-like n=1 Tax=Liolophura sinensis TaxID=3198878 RepID=UPI00315969A0
MAVILQHWREAATLILVCRHGRPKRGPEITLSTPTTTSGDKLKRNFDYKILMVKRSGKSKFMPSTYVFPGGVASDSDFSSEWCDLFQESGVDLSKWPQASSSTVQPSHLLSPMLTRQRDAQFSAVPADVAFRVCAIRETFEESGVLLVRSTASPSLTKAMSKFSQQLPISASLCGKLDEEVLSEWRRAVQKDPGQFLKLCKTQNFLPDIWSLYDWCNWLTPVGRFKKQNRRFDTAFYLSVLDDIPEFVKHDSREIVHTQWSTPLEVFQSFRAGTLWVAPPQLYELARLIQFSDASDIADFASKRSKYHMKRWMSITLSAKDGLVDILPGDYLYPKEVDWEEPIQSQDLNKTLEELKQTSPKNRVEFHGPFDVRLCCDFDHSPEHISPVSESDLVSLDVHPPTAKL